MSEQRAELFESMEGMKKTYGLHYDYFKHLTTLSLTSIGAIIALIGLNRFFSFLFLAGISILCFLACLITALWAMPVTINSIFYILARKPQAFKPGDEWHPERSQRSWRSGGKSGIIWLWPDT